MGLESSTGIVDSTFESNSAGNNGGAIDVYHVGGKASVAQCAFASNTATAAGLAIRNGGVDSHLVLTNLTGLRFRGQDFIQVTEAAGNSTCAGNTTYDVRHIADVDGRFMECEAGYRIAGFTYEIDGVREMDGVVDDTCWKSGCYPAWATCEVCGSGSYTSVPAQLTCFDCPMATYNDRDDADSSDHDAEDDCLPCSGGTFSGVQGA